MKNNWTTHFKRCHIRNKFYILYRFIIINYLRTWKWRVFCRGTESILSTYYNKQVSCLFDSRVYIYHAQISIKYWISRNINLKFEDTMHELHRPPFEDIISCMLTAEGLNSFWYWILFRYGDMWILSSWKFTVSIFLGRNWKRKKWKRWNIDLPYGFTMQNKVFDIKERCIGFLFTHFFHETAIGNK